MGNRQARASWQAHFFSWVLRHRLKPRLKNARSMDEVRRLMTPPRFHVPGNIRIEPAHVGGVPGEWVAGPRAEASTLIYVHGGGYFACSPETHRAITVGYAREGFRVFAPDYRRAPEHCYPAALDDVAAVYRALLAESSDIVVSGDSAGGGLALALMLSARDAGLPLPAAAALFSPWTDLAATGESLLINDRCCAMFDGKAIGKGARHYLGGTDPRNPLVSPLYADLRGLPPLLIHAAQSEVLRDDSIRFAERAREAGVSVAVKIWPAVSHAWQLATKFVPEARQSIREASGFLHAAVEALPARVRGNGG